MQCRGPRDVLVSRKRRKDSHTSAVGPMSPQEQKTLMVRTSCVTRLCRLERYPSADTLCGTHLPKQIRSQRTMNLRNPSRWWLVPLGSGRPASRSSAGEWLVSCDGGRQVNVAKRDSMNHGISVVFFISPSLILNLIDIFK